MSAAMPVPAHHLADGGAARDGSIGSYVYAYLSCGEAAALADERMRAARAARAARLTVPLASSAASWAANREAVAAVDGVGAWAGNAVCGDGDVDHDGDDTKWLDLGATSGDDDVFPTPKLYTRHQERLWQELRCEFLLSQKVLGVSEDLVHRAMMVTECLQQTAARVLRLDDPDHQYLHHRLSQFVTSQREMYAAYMTYERMDARDRAIDKAREQASSATAALQAQAAGATVAGSASSSMFGGADGGGASSQAGGFGADADMSAGAGGGGGTAPGLPSCAAHVARVNTAVGWAVPPPTPIALHRTAGAAMAPSSPPFPHGVAFPGTGSRRATVALAAVDSTGTSGTPSLWSPTGPAGHRDSFAAESWGPAAGGTPITRERAGSGASASSSEALWPSSPRAGVQAPGPAASAPIGRSHGRSGDLWMYSPHPADVASPPPLTPGQDSDGGMARPTALPVPIISAGAGRPSGLRLHVAVGTDGAGDGVGGGLGTPLGVAELMT